MNRLSSWLGSMVDRLVGVAAGLLVAAVLVYFAVHLIISIWVPLVVMTSIGLVMTGLFLVCRWVRRNRAGW